MPDGPGAMSRSPEALVVALARTGDEDAFAELVQRRQQWVRSLMRRLCSESALADDLAQQVFFSVWRDLGKLKDPRRFPGWLKQLAVNVWRQHARRQDPLRYGEALEDSAGPTATSAGLAMDLDRALATLAGDERACVVLSYQEGLSHSEIAALLELPLGTVKSHIRRGGERLKQQLGAYAQDLRGDDA